jgi:2,3-bisphosphoglycerate-independent phosphoglycerate mutase
VKRIEDFDQEVGEALRALEGIEGVRVCAGTDSVFVQAQDRPAAHAQTPFVVWGAGVEASNAAGFSEKAAALGRVALTEGRQLINYFTAKGKFVI